MARPLPRLRLPLSGVRQRIREAQLDERLTAHADSLGLAVKGPQELDGKVDVHALHFPAGTLRILPVQVLIDLIRTRLEKRIELLSRDPGSTRVVARIPLARAASRGGPR